MTQHAFGKYIVTRRLGRGGMAEVFLALHPDLERQVAIKVIYPHFAADEGFGQRFRREARLVASLRHPHIVQLFDYDLADGQPYMVMEFLPSGTLKERLAEHRARGEPLPPGEVARLLRPLADALGYAHRKGVIHRDLKPTNILFTERDEPVLVDFGIAKILEDTFQYSVTGGILGTPAYMSPEQAAGKAVGVPSDLYSLGVVLYQMLTGQVPFSGDSATAVMMKHLQEPPPPARSFNPNLPASVDALLMQMLAKEPAARPASAEALALAFDAALRGVSPAPTPPAADADAPTLADGGARLAGPERGAAGAPPPREPRATVEEPATLAEGATAEEPRHPGGGCPRRGARACPRSQAASGGGSSFHAGGGCWGKQPDPAECRPPTRLLAPAPVRARAGRWPRRRLALAVLGVGLALLLAVAASWAWPRGQGGNTGQLLVAVGQFDESGATRRVDFGRRIAEQLQGELRDVAGLVTVERTESAYSDSAAARADGAARSAALVIWGWYDDAGVSPHLEVLAENFERRTTVEVPLLLSRAEGAAPQSASAASLPTLGEVTQRIRVPATIPAFDLFVADGPEQMTSLAAAILGLSFYLEDDPERALSLFDRALEKLPAESMVEGLEAIYFYRAAVLFQQDKAEEAIADLRRATEIEPGLYEARYNLAIALAGQCGQPTLRQQAIAEAEQAARIRPDSAEAHLLRGSLYLEGGQPAAALEAIRQAEALEPENPEVHTALADLYSATDQPEAAVGALERALTLQEEALARAPTVAARLTLADTLVAAGRYEQAIAAYEAAQAEAPSNPDIERGLGNAYYWLGELEAAETHYQRYAAAEPTNPTGPLLLGLLYQEQGEREAAIAAFEASAALEGCDASAHILLGGLYTQGEAYADAAVAFEAAATLDPTNADAQYLLGTTRYLQGDLEGAIAPLEAATSLQPDEAVAWFALGSAYGATGAWEQALAAQQQATELAPDEPIYLISLASALEKLGRWDEAAAAYEQALQVEASADTYAYLAMVRVQQGRADEAVAAYQEALALDEDNVLAYLGLGDGYAQQGKLAEAIEMYEEAVARDDDPALHGELARFYTLQGDPPRAIAAYEAALAGDPGNATFHVRLATLRAQAGQLEAAATHFQAALEAVPETPDAHYGLAQLAYKQCDLSTMGDALQEALALDPDNTLYAWAVASHAERRGAATEAAERYAALEAAPDEDGIAQLAVGEYLWRSGRPDEAAAALGRVIEQSTLPFLQALAANNLAYLHYEADEWLAAAAQWERALALFPPYADAQAGLGDLALRQGDAEGALAAYEQAEALLPEYAQQFSPDSAALLRVTLLLRRGIALGRLDQAGEAVAFEEAASAAQALVDETPRWPLAHFARGLVHHLLGETEQAEAERAAATQCDPSLEAQWARTTANLEALRTP